MLWQSQFTVYRRRKRMAAVLSAVGMLLGCISAITRQNNRIMVKCGALTAVIDHHNVSHMFGEAATLSTMLPIDCGAIYCLALIGDEILRLLSPLATVQLRWRYKQRVVYCGHGDDGCPSTTMTQGHSVYSSHSVLISSTWGCSCFTGCVTYAVVVLKTSSKTQACLDRVCCFW